MFETDEQLVQLYLDGKELAFDELVSRYLNPIYSFVFRYVNDATVADDLTQDVFFKVWKNLTRFDCTRKFKTWIFEIAKNTAFDFLKKKKALTFSSLTVEDDTDLRFEDTVADEMPLPDELLDEKITRDVVQRGIASLPVDYRTVLILRFNNQLDFTEIAETLDKPLNTVKSQYRRGLLLLKKVLAGKTGP